MATDVSFNFDNEFPTAERGGTLSELAPNVLKQIEATGGLHHGPDKPNPQRFIAGAQSRQGDGNDQSANEVA